jgi:hypothetical protein
MLAALLVTLLATNPKGMLQAGGATMAILLTCKSLSALLTVDSP